jgi:hypothetical protein
VSALVDGVAAVAILGDDPVATRAVAAGIASAQAAHRKVFVGDLLGEDGGESSEAGTGISDMIRYGVSLSRAARASAQTPNVFALEGGAESPLAPDVLASDRWRVLSDQLHRAGNLLLLAVPSQVPDIDALVRQLDGVLLVGDTAPTPSARTLGEVRTAATMRTPSIPLRTVSTRPGRRSQAWQLVLLVAAVGAALLAIPQIRGPVFRMFGVETPSAGSRLDSSASRPLSSLPDVAPRVTSDAAWSTELRFLNSRSDAAAMVTSLGDTMPAATFAEVSTASDSIPWYRVLAGAFSDSLSAENFLASLRNRGSIAPTAGRVTHAPFALLVDSTTDQAMARLRIAGYQGRGLPAYALRDSVNVWRIYVGAFSESAGALRYQQELDSLNIQSVLAVRAGSPT